METSSISPRTREPQLIATLDNNNAFNTNEKLDFNKSTKKIDKIVKKINTMNAENATNVTPDQQNTTNTPETQVIFLDSSNSPNEESITDLIQTEQAPIGDNVVAELQQRTHTETTSANKEEDKQDDLPITTHPQVETLKSPVSSLIYKTPPSSPQPDTISDLDDEDIRAVNEIQ